MIQGTLINALFEKYGSELEFSVSFTTRPPRTGEVHGKSYFFTEKEKFQKMIDNDEFVEWCQVHQNFYGTEKAQIRSVMERRKIVLLDIDIQGSIKMFKAFPETNFIFICPPSIDELKKRLIKRGTDKEEQIAIRLKNAEIEIAESLKRRDMIRYRLVNID